MMDVDLMLKILAFCTGIVGWSWMVVKYVVDRMDHIVSDECKKREEQNEVMTKRHDFDKHVEYTERQLTILREETKASQANLTTLIQQLGIQVNTRLDNLLMVFTKRSND